MNRTYRFLVLVSWAAAACGGSIDGPLTAQTGAAVIGSSDGGIFPYPEQPGCSVCDDDPEVFMRVVNGAIEIRPSETYW